MTQGRVQDRVAIVTGAARGMGAADARVLVREGARVLLTDVLDDEGRKVAEELGDFARYLHHDVTKPGDWQHAVEFAEREFGNISILVNNAGIALRATPIENLRESEYRRVIEVNQIGPFLGIQAVLPSMAKAGGGSIINISSVAGLVGEAQTAAYTATKFAMTGLTKVVAKELGPRNIRVNSIHPGVIATPLLQEMTPGFEDFREMLLQSTPLRRLGTSEEVSSVVLFLASDESSYINGASVVVDGGLLK